MNDQVSANFPKAMFPIDWKEITTQRTQHTQHDNDERSDYKLSIERKDKHTCTFAYTRTSFRVCVCVVFYFERKKESKLRTGNSKRATATQNSIKNNWVKRTQKGTNKKPEREGERLKQKSRKRKTKKKKKTSKTTTTREKGSHTTMSWADEAKVAQNWSSTWIKK